ncbi:hypothetical protein E2562_030332, partial [Oryza meyeriana var. granulata]
ARPSCRIHLGFVVVIRIPSPDAASSFRRCCTVPWPGVLARPLLCPAGTL